MTSTTKRPKNNLNFSFILNSIEDDDKIERDLENVDITAKDKCVIQ